MDQEKGIRIEELYICIANENDPIFTNDKDNQVYLHSNGGIYKRSNKKCGDIWEENYISYNVLKKGIEPIRLHTEELTGQTDNQFERQRHFRSIILGNEGKKEIMEIDLLSVTTTLEVGVDIGSLQAIMLANMPPQRFNYQQRAGRAGRRGQAYSYVMTFCRGQSHDEFYFKNPDKITNDPPPPPFLTMGQMTILKRLLAKEILRRYYWDKNLTNNQKNIHGNFGKIEDFKSNNIANFIKENQNQIVKIIDTLLSKKYINKCSELIEYVNIEFVRKIQSIIDNKEIAEQEDVAQKLAEGGILPMYGMPTDIKYLYHELKTDEALSVNREASIAIYQFAPGTQRTKNKAIHTTIGFTSDIYKEWNNRWKASSANPFYLDKWFYRCKKCGFFKTYNEEIQLIECSQCKTSDAEYISYGNIKSPKAYRTDFSKGKDFVESETFNSRPPIFAEGESIDIEPKEIQNSKISLSDNAITWRINTNSDKFFKGSLKKKGKCQTLGGQQIDNCLDDQWIADDNSQESPIALAAQKHTEIFKVSPISVYDDLDLDITNNSNKGDNSGVRSGYYSAAFLLQRMLASELDVEPMEIEIADIPSRNLDDDSNRKIAEIILADELANGSGFVRYMHDNYENILRELLKPSKPDSYASKIYSHSERCKDSCYECLKFYRNMSYHSLLDWRLGISILRILNDKNYACGADGNFNYKELENWIIYAMELAKNFAKSFNYSSPKDINGLPIIEWGNKNVIAIVHPFWSLDNVHCSEYLSEVRLKIEELYNGSFSIIDTFNLSRRPGWCYEKLVERNGNI